MYTIEKLVKYCDSLVKEFAEKVDAYDYKFVENRKVATWHVNTRFFKIEFVYTKRQKVTRPVSMLYSRVIFSKTDWRYFNIPEFIDVIDDKDIVCYYFPYIESEERMSACFNVLSDFYIRNMNKLNDVALDWEIRNSLMDRKLEEMKRISGLDNEDINQYDFELHEKFAILLRYTSDGPYMEFLRGNYDKALKKYQKFIEKGTCSAYEHKIINLLRNRVPEEKFEPLVPECASIFEGIKFNGGKQDNIAFLKGIFICEFIFFLILYILREVVSIAMTKENLIYAAGMPWWAIAIFAGLPSVFGSMNFRMKLARFTRRKDIEKVAVYDEFFMGKFGTLLAKGAWFVTFVLSVVVVVGLTMSEARFYDKYITFPTDTEALVPMDTEKYAYEDIEGVYYLEGRYNDYGDYIDRASYAIVFRDGYIMDLDSWCTMSEAEENILELVMPYCGEIIKVKTEEDIDKLK